MNKRKRKKLENRAGFFHYRDFYQFRKYFREYAYNLSKFDVQLAIRRFNDSQNYLEMCRMFGETFIRRKPSPVSLKDMHRKLCAGKFEYPSSFRMIFKNDCE